MVPLSGTAAARLEASVRTSLLEHSMLKVSYGWSLHRILFDERKLHCATETLYQATAVAVVVALCSTLQIIVPSRIRGGRPQCPGTCSWHGATSLGLLNTDVRVYQ
jgi:hypothetical protein